MREGETTVTAAEQVQKQGWEFKLHLQFPAERLQNEPLLVASRLANSIDFLEDALHKVVTTAQERGHSWSEIGEALGITKQSAWRRFS